MLKQMMLKQVLPAASAVMLSAAAFGQDEAEASEAPALEACPISMVAYREDAEPLLCACAPDRFIGSVYGSGPYTDDSGVCAAAQHAGAVDPQTGGNIAVMIREGQDAYEGTQANGIASISFGFYPRAFAVMSLADYQAAQAEEDAPAASAQAAHADPAAQDAAAAAAQGAGEETQADGEAGDPLAAADGPAEEAQPGAAAAEVEGHGAGDIGACPSSLYAQELRGELIEASFLCTCPADLPSNPVYGSGPYTSDSDICRAARHAGAIPVDAGGVIRVSVVEPLDAYSGSQANGVSSNDFGPWDGAFTVEAAE